MSSKQPGHVHVAIIGNGFSGLGAAIALRKAGIEDFLIFDKAKDVGGTWRENTYPGCACDVPAALYSFSFAPNPNWTHMFARQPEIHQYLRDIVDRFKLRPKLRGGEEMLSADWQEESQRWLLRTSSHEITADYVIASSAPLHDPSIPELPGLEGFQGAQFHSAQWDHDYDLTGKRVAVIGTGASAIQFIPAIQPQIASMVVFQRTPSWVAPRPDREFTAREKRLFKLFPPAQRLLRGRIYLQHELGILGFHHRPIMRWAEDQLRTRYLPAVVPDEKKRAQLTPDYWMGCKRILLSDNYYEAMSEDNVSIISSGIKEVKANSVVDNDGVEHEVDAIIFGTGFRVTESPLSSRVRGIGGKTISQAWEGSPKAHLGISIAGFPNLFLMVGPNTGLGHNSIVLMIEAQVKRVVKLIQIMDRHSQRKLEVRRDVQDAFAAEMDSDLKSTVWEKGGCEAWYRDKTGRVSALWPYSTLRYRLRMRQIQLSDYKIGS